MISLLPVLAICLVRPPRPAAGSIAQREPVASGTIYLALPRLTKVWYADSGKPVPTSKLWFHRLQEAGTVGDVHYFTLDRTEKVKARTVDLAGKDRLVPIISSREADLARQRYLGKRVWFYGGTGIRCGFASGQSIPFTKSLRIKAIYELAGNPEVRQKMDYGDWSSEPLQKRTSSEPYLFFQVSQRDLSRAGRDYYGANAKEFEGLNRHRIYPSDGYFVADLGTNLSQQLSLSAPPTSALRANRHRPPYLDMGDVTRYLKGYKQSDIAWVFGFPADQIGNQLPQPFQATQWHCGCCWEFTFKHGRVTSAYEEMSH